MHQYIAETCPERNKLNKKIAQEGPKIEKSEYHAVAYAGNSADGHCLHRA